MLAKISDIDRTKIASDILIEYLTIKDENPDCIILFQIGAFWETLFEDAKIISELTGMAQGTRVFKGIGEVVQCGFSSLKNFEIYIKRLLDDNHKICICTEIIDDKGKLKRQISRKYTKGTIGEKELLNSYENNYILAIYETDGANQIAYADVSTGQFYKTSGTKEEIKLEIKKIEPNEIIVLNSQAQYFEEHTQNFHTTTLDSSFDSENAETLLKKYCKYTQKEFCTELDEIIEYNLNKYLAMDDTTRKNLELTRTKMFLKKKGSLLWFLNNTKTPMGARMLKKYISEPLLDIAKIKERQDAIEELTNNPQILTKLLNILECFCDFSRICARISNSTILPKDLLSIAKNSYSMDKLYEICKNLNSKLLKLDKNSCLQVLEFSKKVESAIDENAFDELKSGGIIKEGYDSNLDYLKEKLAQIQKRIHQYQEKEKNRLEIEKLKIDSSKVLGFFIEIPNTKIQKVPNNYLKKQGLSNCTRYTTQELNQLEQEYFNLKYKANEYEYELYCEIRKKAKQCTNLIRSISKEIAKIDVLACLAQCAHENNFIKPQFNSEGIFIKDGYHPSLLKLKNEIIKNDTEIKNGNTIVLTGANMSGKSTYLKHNAIITLLAQIGSFVPAKEADLTIIDRLFLRQGSTDDIINNNSSFMVEMNDLKFILDNITNSSFILLDEPAKSTNSKEGGAISRAFCEYLLEHYDAKAIIATHNDELTKLEQSHPQNATNYVMGSNNFSEGEIIDRKIKKGIIKTSLAINTAKLANLPFEIIEKAQKFILN